MINCALKKKKKPHVRSPSHEGGEKAFCISAQLAPRQAVMRLCPRTGMNIKLIISHVISPQELLRLKLLGEFNY